jgi:hypothetical protein
MVTLKLPPGMTPEQARAELRSCISFGAAEITMMHVLEDAPGTWCAGDGTPGPLK